MAAGTVVYTDGACSGNPGPGGWAWAVAKGPCASGPASHTTNQRMEVQAVLEALRALPGSVEVVSDSTYVVNCFRDRWWEGWLKRGWLNSQKKPVANRDLWEPLIALVRERGSEVSFRWVKGHSGDVMNDLVDRLAVAAAQTQRGTTAAVPPSPDDVGPADPVIRDEGSSGSGAPEGHRLLVVGAKPPALGGYDDHRVAGALRHKLAEIIDAKGTLHEDLVVLTGLGLGTEQIAAAAALDAGVPFIAVLAYPDQQKRWPDSRRIHYDELIAKATRQLLLQAQVPATKQRAGAALARRDAWLLRHTDEVIAVRDPDDAYLERRVRSLEDALGETEVWSVAVRELTIP